MSQIYSNVYSNNSVLANDKYQKYLFYKGYSRPISIFCETTNICQNRCVICAYSKMKRKKQTMSLELFDKVLSDYSQMGGGVLNLTPVVGEVFMDKYLVERIHIKNKYDNINRMSFYTNVTQASRFSDDEIKFIIKNTGKVFFSIYGIDSEEYLAMTLKNEFDELVDSIKRLIRLSDDIRKISFCFRFLKNRDDHQIAEWILSNFKIEIPYTKTNEYANWGLGKNIKGLLPHDAKWMKTKRNWHQCMIPLIACEILPDGDVSFCACANYDGHEDLMLGNVNNHSLIDIYNNNKTKKLWNFRGWGNMPKFCKTCSFHISIKNIVKNEKMFDDPIDFNSESFTTNYRPHT